jgi:glycosyltransferase involved in cell wall biosynthesis
VDVVSGQPYPDLADGVNLIKLPGLNLYEKESRLDAFEPSFFTNPTALFEWLSVTTGGFPEPYTFGRRVVQFLRERNQSYDVIHDNQSLCYSLLALQEAGYPVVSTIHHPITIDRQFDLAEADDAGERLLVRRWYNFLNMQSRVASSLDEIICVSESSRRDVVSDFGVDRSTTSVVHNGIDSDRFRPRNGDENSSQRLITTASADVPLKGLKYLLRSLDTLRDDYPDLKLDVVGELNEGGATEQLIEELDLDDRITFHTHIPHDRLVELYSRACVAVCPSLYEGFGLPAGEAMACGVPLVSTTGGALPEVVGPCGRLVEPGNPEALTRAIRSYLEKPSDRRKDARWGRKRVQEQFQWDRAARQTETIYRRAIRRANH